MYNEKQKLLMEYSRDFLLGLYRTMVRIRSFETRAEELFLKGEVLGYVHLYTGQEAIATGVMANLRREDYITSTHRGHGHMIAKGADVNKMMAELFGKATGYCRGKGGSMHIADLSIGVLGANGEVAGGLPIASGAGMAIKIRKTDQVVVAFFGDGASNRGAFAEALNWCSIFKLPVIFVAENNHFASTWREQTTAGKSITNRAIGYDMPGVSVDGNDVMAMYETARKAVDRARSGEGPSLIEAETYRIKGHYIGDPEQMYRNKREVEIYWEKEPIKRFERQLIDRNIFNDTDKTNFWSEAQQEMDKAVQVAQQSEWPVMGTALEDLFIDDAGYDY
jgi:acetoin:2,6-dichlorophenolindophenol oxidoreductase subunit alpha